MARIRTDKCIIDDKEYSINYNCSSKGIFSVMMSEDLEEVLGIDLFEINRKACSLKDLHLKVNEAIKNRTELDTVRSLHIAIVYKCSGHYAELSLGGKNPKAQNDKHYQRNVAGSVIRFEHTVLMLEERGCNKNYYVARKTSKLSGTGEQCIIDGYRKCEYTPIVNEQTIIPYSKERIETLDSIREQFRRASEFMLDIVSNDKIATLLESGRNLIG